MNFLAIVAVYFLCGALTLVLVRLFADPGSEGAYLIVWFWPIVLVLGTMYGIAFFLPAAINHLLGHRGED